MQGCTGRAGGLLDDDVGDDVHAEQLVQPMTEFGTPHEDVVACHGRGKGHVEYAVAHGQRPRKRRGAGADDFRPQVGYPRLGKPSHPRRVLLDESRPKFAYAHRSAPPHASLLSSVISPSSTVKSV